MPVEYPQKPAQVLKYNPQLDGLRFFAVLFVVCYHWIPSFRHTQFAGFLGGMINFFFVLSSYLITGILFSAKDKSEVFGIPKFKVMGVFLLRRTVRIFPAYYLFLLILMLLPFIGRDIKDNAGMYFSYLANYHIYFSNDFPSAAAHIWTLAVEEQFYVLWPLVILFVPQRHLLKTFIFLIIMSVALRAVNYFPTHGVPQAILTQYCVDAFAVGGILAYKYRAPEHERKLISKWVNIALYISIPLSIAIILFKSHYYSFVLNRLLFSIISLKIVEGAVIGYKKIFGKVLEKKPILYLGRISYGIYLYHLLVPVVFWRLYHYAFLYLKTDHRGFYTRNHDAISAFQKTLVSEPVSFTIYAILTIIIASVSWKFLETPLNKLKVQYNFNKESEKLKVINKPAGS